MQCYTDVLPPTAVTHSLSLPFLSASANNLVVAKTSLLQIFSLKSVISDGVDGSSERIHTTKLVLIAQYDLSGTITSIARVKILKSKSGGEALLVALKDAKLSLVEWDPEKYSLSTISIHYYEREDLQGSPWAPELGFCPHHLTVDPSNRCAAFRFGYRNVAILPFHQAGDDLVMDDYDPHADEKQPNAATIPAESPSTTAAPVQTPYASSFVLSLLALDPNLTHPVDLAFLYEYREPTFGILSSQAASSASLLHERRDRLAYAVFTLDLEQRASTTLLSVNNLPYDLQKVLPLPLPIGGALLIGTNELIHVDQAGKTNGVAVNEFAKVASSFPLSDQSNLAIKLEGSVVERLGQGRDLLLVLGSGELAILSFKIDGRSVSGLTVQLVPQHGGGKTLSTTRSCITTIGRGRIFCGSEDGESVVLGWTRKTEKANKPKDTDVNGDDLELEEDEVEDDEDDLYSAPKPTVSLPISGTPSSAPDVDEGYAFRIHDVLINLGPLRDLLFYDPGTNANDFSSVSAHSRQSTEIIAATGRGKNSALYNIRQEIHPTLLSHHEFPGAYGIWHVAVTIPDDEADIKIRNLVFISSIDQDRQEVSSVHQVVNTSIEEVIDSDFDPSAGATIDAIAINGGLRVAQILMNEIRTYDSNLGLCQIFPLAEDESEQAAVVRGASYADQFILLYKNDSSIMVVKIDESGDLEEVERDDASLGIKCVSGCLYEDSNDIFRLESDDESDDEVGNVLMFLLTADGGLKIYQLPKLSRPVYEAPGLSFLPPYLSTDFFIRRTVGRAKLNEILVAELGDSVSKSPYLILRGEFDELTIYHPYQSIVESRATRVLSFLKIPHFHRAPFAGEHFMNGLPQKHQQTLRAIPDLGGYSAVVLPAAASSVAILKPASSLPKIFRLNTSGIKCISSLDAPGCRRGIICIGDEGAAFTVQLPSKCDYSTGWTAQMVYSGDEIQAMAVHATSDRFVVGTSHSKDFKLPDDELHPEWSVENASQFPVIDHGTIKLLYPGTWSMLDEYSLESSEMVTCIKTMNLETSEVTSNRRDLVVVGTAVVRGEDLSALGRIYVFDIINVVPDPDVPYSDRKLKLIAKEEVKGAVTALSDIGSEGFLLVAQGQKCMVRGLKEDGTLLPVAFIDMQCYVSVAKELKGTGLCLIGDAIKGVWFTGYTEEPYQLRLFGKTSQPIEVMTADFLPDNKQLYIIAVDLNSDLHVLQFDPEHPKSLSGQRLLHLSTFHTGSFPVTMNLVPRQPTPYELYTSQDRGMTRNGMSNGQNSEPYKDPPTYATHQVLLTSDSGAMSLLTSLSPSTYRMLLALQSYLTTALPHPLGLNPRAYRAVDADLSAGGRGVIDGNLLRRWGELGSWKKNEALGRIGVESEEMLGGLLQGLDGWGLG